MRAVPVLKCRSIEASLEFYKKLGFEPLFVYRPVPSLEDPAYSSIRLGDCEIHLSSHSGDGAYGSAVLIECEEVDSIYKSIPLDLAYTIHLPPTNQDWGRREVHLRDPDNHSLRFSAAIE